MINNGGKMKNNRLHRIIEIVESMDVETQSELVNILLNEGYKVTQATISRDIGKLNLKKILKEDGKYKYVYIREGNETIDSYKKLMKTSCLSFQCAGNIIVVKTISGMAMAIATALDGIKLDDIIGCIAGDDTVFCVVKDEKIAVGIKDKLLEFISV